MKTADKRSRVSLPLGRPLRCAGRARHLLLHHLAVLPQQLANLINILQNSARIGIVACAATLLLIGGQFDLSVGSAAAFVVTVTAIAAATDLGSPIHTRPAIVGRAPGRSRRRRSSSAPLNGASVTVFRINALITTLAPLAILRGADQDRERRPDRQPPRVSSGWAQPGSSGSRSPCTSSPERRRDLLLRPPVHHLRALDVCHRRESHGCSTGRHPDGPGRSSSRSFYQHTGRSLRTDPGFPSRQRFAERRDRLELSVVTAVVLGGASRQAAADRSSGRHSPC